MLHNKAPHNSKASNNNHLFFSWLSRSMTLVGSAGLGGTTWASGSPSCCWWGWHHTGQLGQSGFPPHVAPPNRLAQACSHNNFRGVESKEKHTRLFPASAPATFAYWRLTTQSNLVIQLRSKGQGNRFYSFNGKSCKVKHQRHSDREGWRTRIINTTDLPQAYVVKMTATIN